MAEQNQAPENHEQTAAQQNPAQALNYDDIFRKLDTILDKRSEGLAKSALKDNGIDESEISEIVKAYREQKQSKASEQENALSAANKTIADLQKQIADRDIMDSVSAAALSLGVDAKQIPYVSRLADCSDVLGEDGKPDAEKIKSAVSRVLEDVPALKLSANQSKGFQQIGTKSADGADSGADSEKTLRSYFGLK